MPATPPESFGLFMRWFWLIAIVTSFFNAAMYYARARRHMASEPELADSYPPLIKGYLIWSNIPWVVMGLVILFGQADNLFDFLNPRGSGAGVMIWYASVGLVWAATVWWVFVSRW